MAINIPRGDSDETLDTIKSILEMYQAQHPRAEIDLYRQNPMSVRVRIVDPDFHGLDKSDRHERVWHFLDKLPEETAGDISMLVLLAPVELKNSFANMEFEDPVPSRL